MYLHLSNFEHLRDDQTVRFREETVNGVEVVIIAYMLSNDALWAKPLGLETRGPTFLKSTGDLISLPFEKFFNVNEKAHTQAHIVKDFRVTGIYDKRDGSMITGANLNGKVVLKTKKSFVSDVALDANKHAPQNVLDLIDDSLSLGHCPIFEYTSPDNKVVLDYGNKPGFVLLASRRLSDGKYLDYEQLTSLARIYDVPLIHKIDEFETVEDCLNAVETKTDVEGWVIYTAEGRFKVKTKWYCDRHHLIDIRERDVALMVIDETIDDLIPNLLAAEADMESVRRIEQRVAEEISAIVQKIKTDGDHAATIPLGMARAAWVNDVSGELAKFVHRSARGIPNSDEMIRNFYRQRYLSNFSLRSIGNPNFRSDDDE